MIKYTTALVSTFKNDPINPPFINCKSIGSQYALNSMSEYAPVNEQTTMHLNREIREPERFVFYK